jgi:hypothetical protein
MRAAIAGVSLISSRTLKAGLDGGMSCPEDSLFFKFTVGFPQLTQNRATSDNSFPQSEQKAI